MESLNESYANTNYQVRAIGGSAISSNNPDGISRTRNALVKAYKRFNTIPKILVIINENDIINSIQHDNSFGISQHYDDVIEWLFNEISDINTKFRSFASSNALKNKTGWPHLLWMAPSLHDSYKDNDKRRKFTKARESFVNLRPTVASLRPKHVWDPQNDNLFPARARTFHTGRMVVFLEKHR